MTETEPTFRFDEAEKTLIKKYVNDSYKLLGNARELRKHLELRNAFDNQTTYEDFMNDKPLMEALLIVIGDSLHTTIPKSNFGLGKFSDYEIYHQARNDEGLNKLIEGI